MHAVTSRDFENLPVVNPEDVIGGRIPGVTVLPAGGQPGSGGTIRIRGQNTASQTPEPLIYIDGVSSGSTSVTTSGLPVGSNVRCDCALDNPSTPIPVISKLPPVWRRITGVR